MGKVAGRWLIGIGLVHILFGLWFGLGPLAEIAADGFFNAVDPYRDRQLIFWFLFAGPLVILIGQLVYRLSKTGAGFPRWLAWELIGIVVVGGVLMPVSGIWFILVPAFLILSATKN